MRSPHKHQKPRGVLSWILVTVLLLLTAAVGMMLNASKSPETVTILSQDILETETPNPSETPDANPIYTGEEAIARTLAEFPEGQQPIAKLLTHHSLQSQWFGNPIAPTSFEANTGVWLVGAQASMPANQAIVSLDPPGPDDSTDTTMIDGIFIGWDANSGYEVTKGLLKNGGPFTYSGLQSLAESTMTIAPPTATPTPTP